MITVKVNQKTHKVATETTVFSLLAFLKIERQGIAVAVNNHVIKKCDWGQQKIMQNDVVLIIQSTQGG